MHFDSVWETPRYRGGAYVHSDPRGERSRNVRLVGKQILSLNKTSNSTLTGRSSMSSNSTRAKTVKAMKKLAKSDPD